MAIEAAVALYRKQMVAQFEQKSSLLRATTTKESMTEGLTSTFLIAGSGSDTAVTRGTNGLIPYGNPTNSQVTATLIEKHAPYELTGFNVFASQGNQLQVMQNASMSVINRDIDLTILAELANATQDITGTAVIATVAKARAILGQNDVDVSDANNVFAVISPAVEAGLVQTANFTSGDYVDVKPLAGPVRKMFRWMGVNWIVSSRITGMGTSSELCYFYHRDAIGYAVNMGEENIRAGYDEKQDTSWSDAKVYHAAKILQNTGIIKWTHDGSAYAAS